MSMLTNYVLLLFAISFCMYLGGFTSAYGVMMDNWYCDPIGISGCGGIGSITSAQNLILLLVPAFVGAAAAAGASAILAGSFSVMFTLPAGFITVFAASFMFLPLSYLVDPSMPGPIKVFLTGFLSILLILAVIEFIRGM